MPVNIKKSAGRKDSSGSQRLPKLLAGGLLLWLVGIGLIYQLIWGFGGFYTHTRYIPVPDNLLRDEATSLIDIDAYPRQSRDYWAAMPEAELVAFNQRVLPEAGWRIVAEGPSPDSKFPYYCIIARRGWVTAYLQIRKGATPDIAAAFIRINTPDSLCDYLGSP